jgi:DNA primase
MGIKEIKALLSIETVLRHYGLKPDKNDRLLCPFHPDKTPSLQIYPKTNTFCCFSSNCTAGTGDQIQFIELMDKCNKHEAILKATSLVGTATPAAKPAPAKLFIEVDELEKAALMGKVFSYFKKSLPLTKKAVDYLQGRCIYYPQHEIGYNSGGLHGESKNHHLVNSMEKYGLLKPLPTRGHSVWARDCVIFLAPNTRFTGTSNLNRRSPFRSTHSTTNSCFFPGTLGASAAQKLTVESDRSKTGSRRQTGNNRRSCAARRLNTRRFLIANRNPSARKSIADRFSARDASQSNPSHTYKPRSSNRNPPADTRTA